MVKCHLITLYQATQRGFQGLDEEWGSWCEDKWDTIEIISQSNIFDYSWRNYVQNRFCTFLVMS